MSALCHCSVQQTTSKTINVINLEMVCKAIKLSIKAFLSSRSIVGTATVYLDLHKDRPDDSTRRFRVIIYFSLYVHFQFCSHLWQIAMKIYPYYLFSYIILYFQDYAVVLCTVAQSMLSHEHVKWAVTQKMQLKIKQKSQVTQKARRAQSNQLKLANEIATASLSWSKLIKQTFSTLPFPVINKYTNIDFEESASNLVCQPTKINKVNSNHTNTISDNS